MVPVPDGVDAERSAHAEARRDLVAHRAQLTVELGELAVGQARWRHVAHPAEARPAMQLLGEAEHAARRPSPIATAEHDSPSIRRWRISVRRQRDRPPRSGRRVRRRSGSGLRSQTPRTPADGTLGHRACLGSACAGAARRGSHRPRVAHRRQPLGRRSEQLTALGHPRHEVGPVLEPGAVHDRVGIDVARREPPAPSLLGAVAPASHRAQVDVAEAVERVTS